MHSSGRPEHVAFELAILIVSSAGCGGVKDRLAQIAPPPAIALTVLGTGPGMPQQGLGSYHVGVVPHRWYMNFRNDDHHIRRMHLKHTFGGFHRGNGWVTWESNIRFNDKNADDPFNCFVQFTIFGIPRSVMHYQSAGIRSEHSGGPNSYSESYVAETLKGFTDATVVLTGWRFGFWETDHHIAKVGLRLTNVQYNSAAGQITWTVTSTFKDQNGDDDYFWQYDYLIIALNAKNLGTAHRAARSTTIANWFTDAGGTRHALGAVPVAGMNPLDAPLPTLITRDPALESRYDHVLRLPQGWQFELPGNFVIEDNVHITRCNDPWDDAHIRRIRFDLGPRIGLSEENLEFVWHSFDCATSTKGGHEGQAPAWWGPWQVRTYVPFYVIDLVTLLWDGGGMTDYPPEDWLNEGNGWRCDLDGPYWAKAWQYWLSEQFGSW